MHHCSKSTRLTSNVSLYWGGSDGGLTRFTASGYLGSQARTKQEMYCYARHLTWGRLATHRWRQVESETFKPRALIWTGH